MLLSPFSFNFFILNRLYETRGPGFNQLGRENQIKTTYNRNLHPPPSLLQRTKEDLRICQTKRLNLLIVEKALFAIQPLEFVSHSRTPFFFL